MKVTQPLPPELREEIDAKTGALRESAKAADLPLPIKKIWTGIMRDN